MISLVVPAAGCGARANLNGNKILAPLLGKPLLWHTLRGLTELFVSPKYNRISNTSTVEVLIAARRDEWETVQSVWNDLALPLPFRLVEGGATRQDSVRSAVEAARGKYVAVHDAARPAVTAELFERVFEAAQRCGAAIPALPVSDTVKQARAGSTDETSIAQTLARETIFLAQTPQIFRRAILLEAFESAARNGFVGTDCSSLVERLTSLDGTPKYAVALARGDERNLKVTYAADIERAAAYLSQGETHV
ncbi:MAG TPA: IspD/TarI family cytidylyltransferase [Abditibacteriaceae bacterium]